MFERRLAPIAVVAAVFVAGSLSAEDLTYVSDEELEMELQNRLNDIGRTKERIESLAEDEIAAARDLSEAELTARENEELIIARAKLFYRFYRNGGSLRYLLGSSSAVELLKRLDQLKRMLEEGLENKRSFGARVVEAQSRIEEIRESREQAEQMLAMLKSALADLEQERRRRDADSASPELAALKAR